jgi:hypothetical protein
MTPKKRERVINQPGNRCRQMAGADEVACEFADSGPPAADCDEPSQEHRATRTSPLGGGWRFGVLLSSGMGKRGQEIVEDLRCLRGSNDDPG